MRNRVRRSAEPITAGVLDRCIVESNLDIEKVEGFEELGTQESEWKFAEKTRLMHAYLIDKLNTDLHDKTVTVEDKNDLEIYRQMFQIVDAVPENAALFMNAELQQLAKVYGPKDVDLKTLYAFRLLLKKKNAEYKNIGG